MSKGHGAANAAMAVTATGKRTCAMIWKPGWFLLLVVAVGEPVHAQEWARKMFRTTEHDFGTVARQSKAEFEFTLTNLYMEDVHIASATSSCSCTEVSVPNPWLKTYQSGAILAKFNTRAFTGRKGATITVTFDKPYPATVQLHTSGYIRDDVVVEPSSVNLGTIEAGTPTETTVAVNYAGRLANWQVVRVQSPDPHITAQVVQTRNYRGQPSPSCTLRVRLSENAPSGYVKQHLVLVTNDPSAPQIPVLVEGWVRPMLSVSPASLFLGELAPGQSVTRQVVVQAAKPFRVLAVEADGNLLVSTSPNVGKDSRPVQVIPVTITANARSPGKLEGTIHIKTDLNQQADLSAVAVVKS